MMLEPTALPRLRPALPREAATTDTANSGIEVPKPTTVRPTTNGDTPRRRASRDEPSTSQSAPLASAMMPATTNSHGSSDATGGS